MAFQMALAAQPNHFERFIVVLMVLLGFLRTAVGARMSFQFAAPFVDIGIRPAVHFLSSFRAQSMSPTILTHLLGVAWIAVSASGNSNAALGAPHCL